MSSSDSAAPSLSSTDAGSSLSSSAVPPSSSSSAGAPSASTAIVPATTQQTTAQQQQGGPPGSSLDEQIERLKRCEYLRENEVKALCLRAREILVDEGNVQRVDAPVTVSLLCGLVRSWKIH